MIHLPRPTEAKRQRDLIRSLAHQLDNHTIDAFLERARYPETDPWLNSSSAGGGNDVARPVEAAVLRDAGGRLLPDGTCTEDTWSQDEDRVRQAIAELFAQLAETSGLMSIIDQRRQWLTNIHDSARGRTNSVELCYGCDEPIITKEGLAGKVKRLDGKPYHHPDPVDGEPQPQCWWHAYRKRPDVAS